MLKMSEAVNRTGLCLRMIGLQHRNQRIEHCVLNTRVLCAGRGVAIPAIVVVCDQVPKHECATGAAVGIALEHLTIEIRDRSNACLPIGPRDVRIPERTQELETSTSPK